MANSEVKRSDVHKKVSKRTQKKRIKKEKIKMMSKPKRFFRFVGKSVLTLSTLGLIGGLSVGAYGWHKYGDEVSTYITQAYEISEKISIDDFEQKEPTQILDKNGDLLKELKERNFEELDYTNDDELYKKVSDVVTSIEDERYYNHHGFDYYGVGTAVASYALKGGQMRGASTITQQLVKNVYLNQDRQLSRKIKEAVISQELEEKFTKREILQFYVNDNYYSQGIYGLETASKFYFGKNTKDLTTGQLAVLVGIPNNPLIYDPVSNPENALGKRNVILAKMLEVGKINEKEYGIEKNKPLELNVQENYLDNSVPGYAESFALHNVVETLMDEQGFQFQRNFKSKEIRDGYKAEYDELYAQTRDHVLRGGYKVETSIDKEMQSELQDTVDYNMANFGEVNEETGFYTKQSAATTIDNETGLVVAIVGGRTQENATYNRAFLSPRQPGSTIKPFLSYTTAFESGYNTDSVLEDKAIVNGPKNWYDGYWGNISLRRAMEQSVNTVAYRLVEEYGTEKALSKLERMDFAHLTETDSQSPIVSVGGFAYGATTTEMAGALSTLVNQGKHTKVSNVSKITLIDSGKVVYDHKEEIADEVYDKGASYMTLDIMKDVITKGTGSASSFGYKHLAGKTGTTDGNRDAWFVGATPYYTTSVWTGNDNPSDQDYIISTYNQMIFRDAMKKFHEGKKVIDFVRPEQVTNQKGVLKNHMQLKTDVLDSKRALVATKREKDRLEQTERLQELSYRLEHGLTLEQELEREEVAETKIELLESFYPTDLNQAEEVNELIVQIDKALDRVKRLSVYNELNYRSGIAKTNIENAFEEIRVAIEAEKQRIREEAERVALQEEQEKEALKQAEKKERERILQEKLDEEAKKEEAQINKERQKVEENQKKKDEEVKAPNK